MGQTTWNSRGYKKFDEARAREYGVIANEVFAPIYPVIAERIKARCGAEDGLCVDVGTGPANLAIALAKLTRLRLCAMDFSRHIYGIAKGNIEREGLSERVMPAVGDVHRMPLRDGVASLIVSRGSLRFWRNKPLAFTEMKRVLMSGGKGFVGGGMGSAELGEAISREMIKRGAHWQNKPVRRTEKKDRTYWKGILDKVGFSYYEITQDDSGFWIYFEKE